MENIESTDIFNQTLDKLNEDLDTYAQLLKKAIALKEKKEKELQDLTRKCE